MLGRLLLRREESMRIINACINIHNWRTTEPPWPLPLEDVANDFPFPSRPWNKGNSRQMEADNKNKSTSNLLWRTRSPRHHRSLMTRCFRSYRANIVFPGLILRFFCVDAWEFGWFEGVEIFNGWAGRVVEKNVITSELYITWMLAKNQVFELSCLCTYMMFWRI